MSLQPERARAQADGVMAFMPFYFERFCWTTRGWPTEARWAYLILLCEQYTAGFLPADPKVLERLSPGTLEHWELIEPKVPISPDGKRRNQRCTEHREKSLGIASRRREAARIAALAKHGRMPDACETDASRRVSGSGSGSGTGSEGGNASETLSLNGDAVEHDIVSGDNETGNVAGRRKAIGTDENFAQFWALYPRRVGKQAARKVWDKSLKALADWAELADEAAPAAMTVAVRYYANHPDTRALEPQFVPHPATWLNRRQFIDCIEQHDAEAMR